eukprot:SAG11_NODE_1026_length_6141_cov_13.737008_5_plen_828_part_00
MMLLRLILLATVSLCASANQHDGLPESAPDNEVEHARPPPGPPAPSCNKVAGCSGHGICTPTLPGGTCKCNVGFAPSPPGKRGGIKKCANPTAATIALEEKYNATRDSACATVLAKIPTLKATEVAAFMKEYQGFMGNTSEAPVIAAAAKVLADPELTAFLSLPDSFSTGGLDAAMVKCALMSEAARGTTAGRQEKLTNLLAVFAVQSSANEALVEKLLGDPLLMRDMLMANHGEVYGMYGEAMAIYTELLKSSSELRATIAAESTMAAVAAPWDGRNPANVLKRLAVGTAIGLAKPVALRFFKGRYVDPVQRYLAYETAYKAGVLDPAFSVLTSFELSMTVNADSLDEDFLWLRETMANFRPDNIAMSYHWRYAESVHTDVAYGDSHCKLFNGGNGGVCNGHYSDIPVGGDVCGGRAFWGRFACKGFGRPTWGATEHAHAAMSAWTPTGWTVLLGAPWPDCWWNGRGGEDFVLETQARENRPAFQQVLRGSWVALARDEEPVNGMWHASAKGEDRTSAPANGQGGPWSALMLYLKKSIAKANAGAINRTIIVDPTNQVQKIVDRFAAPPPPAAPITTGADGKITIPAASFASKNTSAPVSVMTSADEGSQLLSNGCKSSVGPPCFHPESSSWSYDVTAAKGGQYYLTVNFSTYHMDQDLWVTVNDAKPVELGVYYTVGYWNETQSSEVMLTTGKNTLKFTRLTNRDVMYKHVFLYTKKPDLPAPPANYTPSPPPPTPSANSYIQVPPSTTCVQQGIALVSQENCGHAAVALGLKYTGGRHEKPGVSVQPGCFAVVSGPYKGNANFNTNNESTCTQPCASAQICMRK